jgi:D-alanyl-D-alanine carboxypeptidase/D-alanyl-D-alanine-endopeptidase (penicillin-binding protein 4)
MAGGDARHSTRTAGRVLRRTTAALVLVVLVLAVAARGFDLGPRVLGWGPSPVEEPAEVAPPPGLTLPEPVSAEPVAPSSGELSADPAKVRRALTRLLRDEDLGPRVAVTVDVLSDGTTVFDTGPDRVTPASTLKLLTTTAGLAALGPDHTFRTTAVAGATSREVVLVGGGDPLLARSPEDDAYPPRADVATLAKATALSLKKLGRVRVRLGYDTSLFDGPAVSPAWRPSYLPDNVVSPISPLWVDEGRKTPGLVFRTDDPALAAATEFARLLTEQGIKVVGRPRPAVAPEEAREYAAVESAPLAQIVQWVLEVSDNEAAEVLFRHVAIAEGRAASFDGGSAAVSDVLGRLGIDTRGARILDGSGLARGNRLSPDTLLAVLAAASSEEHPELRPVVANLPVAGFTGSLTYRFGSGDEEGLGVVRAKTGTLTGVHGLAGTVTDADGVVLSFVAIADRVRRMDTLDARQTLDEVAAALAACSCSA